MDSVPSPGVTPGGLWRYFITQQIGMSYEAIGYSRTSGIRRAEL